MRKIWLILGAGVIGFVLIFKAYEYVVKHGILDIMAWTFIVLSVLLLASAGYAILKN